MGNSFFLFFFFSLLASVSCTQDTQLGSARGLRICPIWSLKQHLKKQSQHSWLKYFEMESLIGALRVQSRQGMQEWWFSLFCFFFLVCGKAIVQNVVMAQEWGSGLSLSLRRLKIEATSWATAIPGSLLVPSSKMEIPLSAANWCVPCEGRPEFCNFPFSKENTWKQMIYPLI